MIDRNGFSFMFKDYVFGYEKGEGFIFGKVTPFEKSLAKDIANKLLLKEGVSK